VGQAGRERRAVPGQGQPRQRGGRVQNNNYEREGETVYSMAFTAEEVDYLDTKAEGEALRAKQGTAPGEGEQPSASATKPAARKAGKGRKAATATAQAELDEQGDPIPV
jgi:single-strand DNA-binding protein